MPSADAARSRERSLEITAALSLAALILYVPANLYPILRMTLHGAYSESTVWDGVVSLARNDQWLVAVIVFLASILIPLLKLLGFRSLSSPRACVRSSGAASGTASSRSSMRSAPGRCWTCSCSRSWWRW